MRFRDRTHAGEELARALAATPLDDPIVLGIPRGGVAVAAPIARAFAAELGVIVARKLRAPANPELGVGATTARGATYVDARIAARARANVDYLRDEIAEQIQEATRREASFDGRRRPPLAGRDVIIVDDGLATGATAVAAVRAARDEGAARVLVAVPAGSKRAIELVGDEADEVVCLVSDAELRSVGQYYDDFRQLTGEEVQSLLG